MQSLIGLHVGIIMDGNGRWAEARGLPRTLGHQAGVEAVRRTCAAAPGLGVRALTLFAFSSDNWKRPEAEVNGMMDILRRYLRHETDGFVREGVRLGVIGRRDRLPADLVSEIARVEDVTGAGGSLHVRLAIDYCGRESVLQAARRVTWLEDLTPEGFGKLVRGAQDAGDVDLVVRTSGERRLSDFLPWEASYAELHFTDVMWPDFTGADLAAAVSEFGRRTRRFGGLVPARAA